MSYGSSSTVHSPTAITISGGTLQTGTQFAFGRGTTRADVSIGAAGTLDLSGFAGTPPNQLAQAGVLGGAGGVVTNNGTASSVLQLGVATNGAGSYAGVIQNGVSTTALLVGDGTSLPTQTLTGTNTYTGGTEVRSGSLVLDGGGSIVAGNTTITGGTLTGAAGGTDGTLNFRVTGDTADLISISAGTLALPNLSLNLVLSGTQTLSEYVLANKAVGSGFVTGTAFGGESLPAGWGIDYDGTATHPGNIVLVAVPVPEPTAVAAIGLILAGALTGRRRR
jgi:autotransporter-associated beta strand protein